MSECGALQIAETCRSLDQQPQNRPMMEGLTTRITLSTDTLQSRFLEPHTCPFGTASMDVTVVRGGSTSISVEAAQRTQFAIDSCPIQRDDCAEGAESFSGEERQLEHVSGHPGHATTATRATKRGMGMDGSLRASCTAAALHAAWRRHRHGPGSSILTTCVATLILVLAGCGGGGSSPSFNLAAFCADYDKTTSAIEAQFNRLDPPSQAELVALATTVRRIAAEAPAAIKGDLNLEADAFAKASTNGNLDSPEASAADDRVIAYTDANCATSTGAAATLATNPTVTETPETAAPDTTTVRTTAVASTTTEPATAPPTTTTQSTTGAVVALSAANVDVCALLKDGTMKCWGDNSYSQLGTQDQQPSAKPVNAVGITAATAIAASNDHTCALFGDGTVKCWGTNSKGEVGNGAPSNVPVTSPATVQGVTNATAVGAASQFTCALLSDGTIKCWGNNASEGALGDGTFTDSATPVTVTGITNATAISISEGSECALLADQTVRCWGAGQLGSTTLPTPAAPTVQVDGITNAVAIAAGGQSCAVLADGTVECWGANDRGQVGNGTTDLFGQKTPVAVTGIANATAVAVGAFHSCALLADKTVACWGGNSGRELGDGTQVVNSLTPVAVKGIDNAVSIVAALGYTCAILDDAGVRCWGTNLHGLGDGTFTAPTPVQIRV